MNTNKTNNSKMFVKSALIVGGLTTAGFLGYFKGKEVERENLTNRLHQVKTENDIGPQYSNATIKDLISKMKEGQFFNYEGKQIMLHNMTEQTEGSSTRELGDIATFAILDTANNVVGLKMVDLRTGYGASQPTISDAFGYLQK